MAFYEFSESLEMGSFHFPFSLKMLPALKILAALKYGKGNEIGADESMKKDKYSDIELQC